MKTSASKLKLLPCPFCGSEAHFDSVSEHLMSDERVYSPACTECSCELMNGPVRNYAGSGWYKTKEAAATDWNCRRVAQEIAEQGREKADLTELVLSEISDFFAGIGQPGAPETPEEMQATLMARVRSIFGTHIDLKHMQNSGDSNKFLPANGPKIPPMTTRVVLSTSETNRFASIVQNEMTNQAALIQYGIKPANYKQWVKGWNALRAAIIGTTYK